MPNYSWGPRIAELLRQHKKRQKWLADQTGISRSTISAWVRSTEGVTPDPVNVAKVAKAFGLKARDLAPYAGMPIIESENGEQRAQRIANLPQRHAAAVEKILRLGEKDQDTVLSMIEGFAASRLPPEHQ